MVGKVVRWLLCLVGRHEYGDWQGAPRVQWRVRWRRCRYCTMTQWVNPETSEIVSFPAVLDNTGIRWE